jgi:3-oxoacyl-[acyl-carrier-protein] synthase II
MEKRRVVITGMGSVNCLGHTVHETWTKIKAGISGIDRISRWDLEGYNSKIAGEVRNFDLGQHFPAHVMKDAKKMDPFVHYAAAATNEAVTQSGISAVIQEHPQRVGVCIGSGIGGLQTQQKNGAGLAARGAKGVSPMYVPAMLGDICAGFMSMVHGAKGPNLATQTACATANHAIAIAALMIQHGMIDACIAGGTEGSVTEIAVAGFSNMRALSTQYNDQPTRASRPYDVGRDGFVIAEGAGILIVEDYEHAKKRGATILAELIGFGMSGDAYDIVQPDPSGAGALYSMQMACSDAGINPSQIDYINAHGTSTPLGDIAESKAIFTLIDGKQDRIHVGSTKSMHGHLLGATAGVEACLCLAAMADNIVPPNINIDQFDSHVALSQDVINTKPVAKPLNIVLSNSFGFGGHNSTLIFRKI